MSCVSVVGIVTGYELDDQGVRIRVLVGSGILTSPHHSFQLWGPPTSYPMGTGGSFPEIKHPGHETDHSHQTIADVKNTWMFTSTIPYLFMD
jgi:hypothetical protein